MKFIAVTILSILIVSSFMCNAAIVYEINAKNTAYPGKCYAKAKNDEELILDVGESIEFPKGSCQQATCDEFYTLTTYSCPPKPNGDCKVLPGDVDKPYPDCCWKIEC